MFFSKRRNHKSQPVLDESLFINNRQQVLETLQALNLPPEKLVITGSAAITLLGLERHAHDLDILAHPSILDKLEESGAISGFDATKAEFSRPSKPHFAVMSSPLPSELFGHRRFLDNPNSSFENFLENQAVQTPDGLFITQPHRLLQTKHSQSRIGSEPERSRKMAQDAYDVALLAKYIKDHK